MTEWSRLGRDELHCIQTFFFCFVFVRYFHEYLLSLFFNRTRAFFTYNLCKGVGYIHMEMS